MNGPEAIEDPAVFIWILFYRDESEPSWLEPELELKGFQHGSARDLFLFSSNSIFFLIYVAKS